MFLLLDGAEGRLWEDAPHSRICWRHAPATIQKNLKIKYHHYHNDYGVVGNQRTPLIPIPTKTKSENNKVNACGCGRAH